MELDVQLVEQFEDSAVPLFDASPSQEPTNVLLPSAATLVVPEGMQEELVPSPVAVGGREKEEPKRVRKKRSGDSNLVALTSSGSISVPRNSLLQAKHRTKSPPKLERAGTIDRDLEDRFGKAKFAVLTTKSEHGDHFHWFRWPSLRQEWLDENHTVLRRDRKDRRANLMELYYDLIFVAVIALIGHSLRLQSTFNGKFFVEFIALFHIWLETLYFLDRFDSGDGLSRLLVLFTMAGVVGMGLTGLAAQQTAQGAGSVVTGYAVSFIWARTAVELLYLTTLSIGSVRMFVAMHFFFYLCVVSFFIGSVWAPSTEVAITLQVIGFSIGLVSPVLIARLPPARWKTIIPFNLEHIVERFALFSIIIIGETIWALFFTEGGAYTPQQWAATGMGLLLSFTLQWIGFDIENGMHGLTMKRHALRRSSFWALTWIFSHIPYDLGVMCMAGGIWNVHHYYGTLAGGGAEVDHRRGEVSVAAYVGNLTCLNATQAGYDPHFDPCVGDEFFYGRWLLCAGAAASLFFMTVNGMSHSRSVESHYLNVKMRALIRLVAVIFLSLIPLAGSAISPLGYLGICCGVYAVQVIVGLEHREAIRRVKKALQSANPLPAVVGATTGTGIGGGGGKREKERQAAAALLASRNVPDSAFDMRRVIDVDFAPEAEGDHENASLGDLTEYESR